MDSKTTRRGFFVLSGAVAVTLGFRGLKRLAEESTYDYTEGRLIDGFGPLQPDPHKILDLPAGFQYRVISRVGESMSDGLFVPGDPDGMSTFPGPDGKTIIIRNHELAADQTNVSPFGRKNELLKNIPADRLYDFGRGKHPCLGGTTTLVYDTKTQKLEKQFMSLAGTQNNCAGGPTPWGSWVSCEETVQRAEGSFEKDHGYNFEVPVDATGPIVPIPLKGMGRFNHEAVCVDSRTSIVYQTEDREDGLVTRYVPNVPGQLEKGGRLEALVVVDRPSLDTRNWREQTVALGESLAARWMPLEEIESPKDDLRYRGFSAGAARFARGEGMWFGRDAVYIACTDGGRARRGQIWRYVPDPERETAPTGVTGHLELFIEPNNPALVDNADNMTMAPWGDLVVCEDGKEENYLVGVTQQGRFYKIAKNAISNSEFAGVTFSPDGSTLFVNIQVDGLTLAITGPWRAAPA